MKITNIIAKMTPKFIKTKIKNHIILSDGLIEGNISINQMVDDLVERKIAAERISINKYSDKVFIVVGGAGFIGWEICNRFASQGAIVYVCSRKFDDIKSKTDGYKGEGKLIPLYMDITKEDSIKEAIALVYKNENKIDVLVNSAGGSARENAKFIVKQDIDIIKSVINVNLMGTIMTSKIAAEYMILQRKGKIINLSSTIGVGGKKEFSEYAAAKAGVIGFSKSLAIELGEYGITVNTITPGIIDRSEITAYKANGLKKTNIMRSVGIANDVACVADLLASDEANFITGQNYIVDGGRSLGLVGDI